MQYFFAKKDVGVFFIPQHLLYSLKNDVDIQDREGHLINVNPDGSLNILSTQILDTNDKLTAINGNLEDHICLDNSTSTPLIANAVFNGAYQDTLGFAEIIVSIST